MDENLESKLRLLQKALENNKAIMNSLEKQLDKELKNMQGSVIKIMNKSVDKVFVPSVVLPIVATKYVVSIC